MRRYYWDDYTDLKLTTPKRAADVTDAAPITKSGRELPTHGPDIVFEHPDKRLPRAVVFRDSFANLLTPLLSEHFRRVVFSRQYTLDSAVIEREKPDVVIHEFVERTLMIWPPPSP